MSVIPVPTQITIDELNEHIKDFYISFNTKTEDKRVGGKKITSENIQYNIDHRNYTLTKSILIKDGLTQSDIIYLPINVDIKKLLKELFNTLERIRSITINLINKNNKAEVIKHVNDIETIVKIYKIISKYFKTMRSGSGIDKQNVLRRIEYDLLDKNMELYVNIHKETDDDNKKQLIDEFILNTRDIFDIQQNEFKEEYKQKYPDAFKKQTGVRNLIKTEISDYTVPINNILEKLNDSQIDTLLSILDVDIPLDDLMTRPRFEKLNEHSHVLKENIEIVDDKVKSTFRNDILYSIENSLAIGKGIPSSLNTINLEKHEIILLTNSDTTHEFKVDDFTFNSVSNYHLASRFYNRQDIDTGKRSLYNNLFFKFTKEYQGKDSLYLSNRSSTMDYISLTGLTEPADWLNSNPTISSIYLRKGLYNKFNQNEELKNILMKTGKAILYQRINKNKYRIYYEMMEIRHILRNNIDFNYREFNYNSDFYNKLMNINKIQNTKKNNIIAEAMSSLDAIPNKYDADIVERIKDMVNIKLPDTSINYDYVYQTLYTYKGAVYYDIILNENLLTDKELIEKHPQFTVDKDYVSFVNYLVILNKKKELEKHKNENKQDQIKDTKEDLEETIIYLKQNKFIPKNIGNNEPLYYSIIHQLVNIDKRKSITHKFNGKRNKTAHKLRLEIYNLAMVNGLNNVDYIKVDNQVWTELEIELLSRYFNMNVVIYDGETKAITEYNYIPIREKYSLVIPGMDDSPYPLGIIRLGVQGQTVFNLQPNMNEITDKKEYLYHPESRMLLQENADETQSYINKWNSDENYIDISPPDEIDGEIEMETLIFYWIDDRCYHKNVEVILRIDW